MSEMSWEHAPEARAALNAIVSDPDHGVAALSSPTTMSNLLKDYLPDAPREKSILVAAAEAGLADTLREHVAQGMDASTAIRLTASSFATSTPFTPEACDWVTSELAIALGISQPGMPGGGNPPGFAPNAGEAMPTRLAGSPGGPASPGVPGSPGGPGQGYQGQGYQGQGAGQVPAQPNPQDQPTAVGYIPGYGQQQGAGYGGAPGAGQVFQGQQGFPAAPPPAVGYPGQQGFHGQQGFQGQQGQVGGTPTWSPSGGFSGPTGYGGTQRKSGGSNRGLFIGGGIAVAVIVVIAVVIALANNGPTPKPQGNGSASPVVSVTTTPPVSPSPTTPATSIESLTTIMNPPGESPVGTKCVRAVLFGLNASSISNRIFCPDTTAKNVQVWGYQFFTASGYRAGLAHINSYTGFKSTSTSCPPAGSSTAGTATWHANHNPKYVNHPGQILECFVDGQEPVLIWTMPTMNTFFIGEDRVKQTTITTVLDWWKTLVYG